MAECAWQRSGRIDRGSVGDAVQARRYSTVSSVIGGHALARDAARGRAKSLDDVVGNSRRDSRAHARRWTPSGGTGQALSVSDDWALLADPFVEGAYATVKGRVRTHVVHHQLLAHLPPPPAAVLDVGGGAGHQSRPLARLGYDVTLVDSSPAMLEKADELLHREPAEVRARVVLVEGRGEEAPTLTGARRFDAVLCHGVLMYVADPAPLLGALCACARGGGLVSIVALNARTMAVRPAMEGRFTDALAGLDARAEIGVLGLETRADTPEELSEILAGHATRQEAWYGVWLFSDLLELAGRAVPDGDLAAVAALESLAARRDPYRQLSRLFHVLGRREGPQGAPER